MSTITTINAPQVISASPGALVSIKKIQAPAGYDPPS
jgi:hypothetical protein